MASSMRFAPRGHVIHNHSIIGEVYPFLIFISLITHSNHTHGNQKISRQKSDNKDRG